MLYVNHLYVESKKCNKVVNVIKEKQRHREQTSCYQLERRKVGEVIKRYRLPCMK